MLLELLFQKFIHTKRKKNGQKTFLYFSENFVYEFIFSKGLGDPTGQKIKTQDLDV